MLFDFAELNNVQHGNLYIALYEKIKQAAECGAVKKGEKLPSVREAAKLLGISRTTVENAYTRLCIEGIAESVPQRGYFITGNKSFKHKEIKRENIENNILFDFSSRRVDPKASDTEMWKKMVRGVLWDSGELTSYGDIQGEFGLREALAAYSYKARGVRTTPENIIIGAGVGPLLNILCGLLGRDIKVGIENGGFSTAESIFSDYGINSVKLLSDKNGALTEDIIHNDIDVLFLLPSALSKISVNAISQRRNEYVKWVQESKERIIIEDDYNGELRYTARTVPAFQSKATQKCVYIGSFSKLLLPSVRIAYMVLPDNLAEIFKKREGSFNQTCGKIEQLALKEYILSGALEKHLRRLRRLYYNKSQVLINEIKRQISGVKNLVLFESSLILQFEIGKKLNAEEIYNLALKNGIKLMLSDRDSTVKLSFAGIEEGEIPKAVEILKNILTK